jgi:hypothetical protein
MGGWVDEGGEGWRSRVASPSPSPSVRPFPLSVRAFDHPSIGTVDCGVGHSPIPLKEGMGRKGIGGLFSNVYERDANFLLSHKSN